MKIKYGDNTRTGMDAAHTSAAASPHVDRAVPDANTAAPKAATGSASHNPSFGSLGREVASSAFDIVWLVTTAAWLLRFRNSASLATDSSSFMNWFMAATQAAMLTKQVMVLAKNVDHMFMRFKRKDRARENYGFTDRIAGECSTISPTGVSGEYGNPAKRAGRGVGFGSMGRDSGQDSRKLLRGWRK